IEPLHAKPRFGLRFGVEPENRLLARGLQMAIRWKVAIDHGKARLLGILVKRAANQQDGRDRIGWLEIVGNKVNKLRDPQRACEMQTGIGWPRVLFREESFQFANGRAELIGASLGAVENR